ncbi:hypothetical protein C0991_008864 [Blastosporella zonata]|nr:hypothetical protein C0991_008864 [Blastosporella zonata]
MKNHSEEGSRSAPSRKPQRARPRTDMVHEEDRVARRDEGERAPRRRPQEKLETEEERAAEEETWNGPQSTSKKPTPHLTAHLNFLFPELHFPDEVARRILTHGSHPAAVYGHNGAFSFVDYGLPQAFNQDADSICKRMGGVEGKLVVLDTPTTPQATQTS